MLKVGPIHNLNVSHSQKAKTDICHPAKYIGTRKSKSCSRRFYIFARLRSDLGVPGEIKLCDSAW